MATTKIWKIKGNMNIAIPKVIDYVKNPEKTTSEKGLLTSAINCDIKSAARDFIYTKEHFGKTDQILAWHGYQSFKHNEVTPELAHRIGVLLAQELWGDRFEVVVATHLDKGHIHNHFVVNSVSCMDGLKFYASTETYMQMRKVSDRLCKEFDLSYIKHPKNGNAKQYGEWNAEQKGLPTKRSLIRRDIDSVIGTSFSWRDFLSQMEKLGYTVNTRGKYAKLKPLGSDKFFRFDKLDKQGAYTEEALRERIRFGSGTYVPKPSYNRQIKYAGSFQTKKKVSGFRALYFYYCYQMGVFKKRPRRTFVTAEMREASKDIEKILEDYHFLKDNCISTIAQLKTVQAKTMQEYTALLTVKKNLKKTVGVNPSDEMKNNFEKTKREMREKSNVIKICIRIEERSKQMQKQLNSQRKEQNNERRSRSCSASYPDDFKDYSRRN